MQNDNGAVELLEAVAKVFHATGRWPVWQFIDRVLDRVGVRGMEAMSLAPDDWVQKPSRLSPDSEMQLTVAGLSNTREGQEDVPLFLDVLQWLTRREQLAESVVAHEAAPIIATSAQYKLDREERSLDANALILRKAYLMLSVELLTGSGGSNLDAGEWSTTADERLRPYRAVSTIVQYQRIRTTQASGTVAPISFGAGNPQRATPRRPLVSSDTDRARVFVVHGRNAKARDAMFEFLRAVGLRPIEWSQAVTLTGKGSPYIGEVLDAAFESAQAVIVVMTPDEMAYLRPEYASGSFDPETKPAPQARPNVLFEAGMAMGRNSERAILVELGTVRPFSDVAGRHAVRLDNSAARRKELAQRLATAGCLVDTTGEDWLTTGDFTTPTSGELGPREFHAEPRTAGKRRKTG